MEKEDTALLSRDSDTSFLEESPAYSSSSEEEDARKEDGQDHGDPWRGSLRGTSMPTVTELWPQFRHGKTKMMAPVAPQTVSQSADCSQDPSSEEVAPWRYGPAKFWYDMLDVPPHGAHDPSKPGGSIFIPENEDLIYGQWEDNIIWDAQAMPKALCPTVLTIDANDENLLLELPEEPVEEETPTPEPLTRKESSKKSQNMLKCGIMGVDEDEQVVQLKAKDPWNLSNDEFYFPQQHVLQVSFRVPIIQHSLPALKLHPRLFPTHMEVEQLRLFHRPQLRPLGRGPHPVQSLIHHIQKKAQERQQKLEASGGGHMFFMKTIQDLSGLDGDLILVEWSEENPPFLNQVGMASQIQNYYKRKIGKDPGPPAHKYGNLVLCSSSPFLGKLHSGQFLQALENKLFRAPIYPHQMADTDFLVVVTKTGYFLREVKDVFTVGQQCPLDEVPAPNSKMAKTYLHGFLQVFIYRQFWNSPHRPRRIQMEDIRRAFPRLAESSIRRRLTKCSDFHRTGTCFNWWVLKSGFRLPREEELRLMLTPEKCCALYSMLAAQQRLKDAGYGEVSLLDTETSDDGICLEDEVQAAPWNTTRAFLAAIKGQCLLEVRGAADPTGCGEGISYVKLKNKTRMEGERLKGTDADLRRLTMRKAQKLLRIFGISEDEIKKLSRWEVIAAVRALSTKKLNSGANSRTLTKFARVSQSSGAEKQRHFQKEVQRIFDLQNKVLASTDVLSTDTDSSTSDEESDQVMDRMCHEIEDLLEGKTDPQKLKRQGENQERLELWQLMVGGAGGARLQEKGETQQRASFTFHSFPRLASFLWLTDGGSATSSDGRLLIHRTYADESGKEYTRSEIVRHPAVIREYVRVKTSKEEDTIRQFFQIDEQKRQELRKEKKRLQDRLRRIRIAEEREEKKRHLPPKKLPKPEALKLNLVCGACGSQGHIKTNRMCPNYCPPKNQAPRLIIMTQEEEEKELAKRLPQESLIKVQETKLFMKKKLLETVNEVQTKTLKVRAEKRSLPKMTEKRSTPAQKRQSVHMDSQESLSCIRSVSRLDSLLGFGPEIPSPFFCDFTWPVPYACVPAEGFHSIPLFSSGLEVETSWRRDLFSQMDEWRERTESGGSGPSEPQKSPGSIPAPQTMALSQAGSRPVTAAGSVLPQLPEGLAALTIPIRLDALSYLLHSALLGAYSLRPGPALCPCHPDPCCARPPASDQPAAQDPPRPKWTRNRSQREALWPGEVGSMGSRELGAPFGTTKQNQRTRPSPIRPHIKNQHQRLPASLLKPNEERKSKYHQRKAVAASTMPPPEEWEREYQHYRPPAPPPQPVEDCEGRYHHHRAPAAEDWESEYQEAQNSTTLGPQDANLVSSEKVLQDPGNKEIHPDAQVPQP
ncbi:uncharacterized protein C19orf84 homolog [Petaurus breviceps papuanus]|uniref:uncharacterized protein C19orf84 homolog n=1 Tax=Petaurus breviceps papuanus TaxID=3040969 RepID=UPI0036D87600